MEISRDSYLTKLKNNKMIKIITGLRRSGKSYLLDPIFKNSLINIKKIIIVKDDINLWINEKGILIISLEGSLLNPNSLDL